MSAYECGERKPDRLLLGREAATFIAQTEWPAAGFSNTQPI